MPGVRKSNRCNNCKRRKVKCDLNWPTCTPCLRVNAKCSGPQQKHKFVLNGVHTSPEDDEQEDAAAALTSTKSSSSASSTAGDSDSAVAKTDPTPWYSIASIRSVKAQGGSAYGFFRVADPPKANPVSRADHLAGLLTSRMYSQKHNELAATLSFLRFLPSRLGRSAALRDAVALFCGTWDNYFRGESPFASIHRQLQTRALASLRDALSGDQQLSVETLAAITLHERLEILFDYNVGKRRLVHSAGMASLMANKGPPDLKDELDVHLSLDNQTTLLGHFILVGGDNIFVSPKWREALCDASVTTSYDQDVEIKLGSTFELSTMYWQWPTLVKELRELNLAAKEGREQTERVESLYRLVQRMRSDLLDIGQPIMARARSLGGIREFPDASSFTGVSYDFLNLRFCELHITFVFCRMIVARMLSDLCRLQGIDKSLHEAEYVRLARQCLMYRTYLLSRPSITCLQFSGALFVGVCGLEGNERDALIDFVLETSTFGKFLPQNREAAAVFFHFVSDGLTGRLTFDVPEIEATH